MIDEKDDLLKLLDIIDTCIKANSDSVNVTNILNKINTLIPFSSSHGG